MTEEQILELAKNFEFDFSVKWRHMGGESSNQMYWECWEEQLLKFAKQVADIEYDRGFDDGWESRADAERMLALSKLNDEELAQDPTNPPVDAL